MDEKTRRLQKKLIRLGYPLPKFGADGDLGPETKSAMAAFAAAHGIPKDVEGAIMAAPLPVDDETETHPGLQWRDREYRPWSKITGITLHQTAVLFGENPQRWHAMNAHIGITRNGRALMICPLQRIVWHGNSLNDTTVGIEVDGYFEGVEGQRRTLWNPATDPKREPLKPSPQQIEACRRTIRWIRDLVRTHGGQLLYIHAHRQSSRLRQSDPGSAIWQACGVWAQRELGLSDGGPGWTSGGLPIPTAWDPSRPGFDY
jgi:N-acetyl-anhydromuramyl-L-alanine amidase AmpD